jgi:hypothetical protein
MPFNRDLPATIPGPATCGSWSKPCAESSSNGHYSGDLATTPAGGEKLSDLVSAGQLSATDLLGRYCAML